jgi:hypothetical protein
MENELTGPEWGTDDDDDFTDLDKQFDNDQEIMKLTGISQSYYDVGENISVISPKEGHMSPVSEKSFNERDLNPTERTFYDEPTRSSDERRTKSEPLSEMTWWEASAVGVCVVLGALSVVALSRRK